MEIVKQTDAKDVEANLLITQGVLFEQVKEYEQALRCFTGYIDLLPDDSVGYFNRGVIYSALKQYERAIEDYEYSIELDPEDSAVYLQRGYTYLWLRDIKQAQSDFTRSWQLDPTYVNYGLMTEWSTMCQEKPDPETAKRLEAIATNDPDNDEAYVCRGVALWIRASYEAAAAELRRAIQLYSELEDTFFWSGVVHAYSGQDDEAIAAIEKSLELGLPPVLLSPLRWVEQDRPDFYQKYAAPLFARFDL